MLMKKEIIEDNKKLKEENKELKQKVKYYENFEINKTVDKIRLENNKIEKELQNQLQQKDKEIERLNNIRNKAREYIKLVATDHDIMNNNEIIYTQMQYEEIENLLEILGSDKE